MILPFGLLLSLSSCKKEEKEEMQSCLNVAQCQQQYNAIMSAFNSRISEIDQIWQQVDSLDCSWYYRNYNESVTATNEAAAQLNGQCAGWQNIRYIIYCPPH